MKLYEQSEFWAVLGTLLGVVLGFLLSVIYEVVKNKLSIRKKRKAIESELRINLGLIPQKIDILNQLKDALNKNKLLPSGSVHSATYLYDLYIGDIGPSLTEDERGCLHVTYESMKFVDKFLDSVFEEFIDLKESGQVPEPFKFYVGKCEEMIELCNLVQNMIKEYLEGKPTKVGWD